MVGTMIYSWRKFENRPKKKLLPPTVWTPTGGNPHVPTRQCFAPIHCAHQLRMPMAVLFLFVLFCAIVSFPCRGATVVLNPLLIKIVQLDSTAGLRVSEINGKD